MTDTNNLADLQAHVREQSRIKYAEVMAQREEIMFAFIAKYGCNPDEIVQVEWRKSHSEILWFLVRKSDCIHCEKCKDLMAKGEPITPEEAEKITVS